MWVMDAIFNRVARENLSKKRGHSNKELKEMRKKVMQIVGEGVVGGENGQKGGQKRVGKCWKEIMSDPVVFIKILAFTCGEIGRHWMGLSKANLLSVFSPQD